ncbi:hypothetical protein BGW37DRAFT_557864, partial [Umbelopsis sp. PMI_123]
MYRCLIRLSIFVNLLLSIISIVAPSSETQGCGRNSDEYTICSPNGGTWMIGTKQNITWNP